MGLLDNIRELDSGSRFAKARPAPVGSGLMPQQFNNPQPRQAPQGMSSDDKSALALSLAGSFAGMSGNPNTNSIMAGIEGQKAAIGARREKASLNQQTVEQRNRTATMLIDMGGDFAKIGTALLRGQIDTDQAMSMHDTIAGKTSDKTFTMMSDSDRIAAGLPVLNNYPGWLAEMIEDNKCGYSVTPENPKLFVDALEDAFNNKDQIESMGTNARALAERDFDRAHLASNWAEWVLDVKQ